MSTNAFLLSRIYSQGWNAAKKLLADGSRDADAKTAASMNPYYLDEERTRWAKGFDEAAQSVAPSFGARGGKSKYS